MSIAPAHNPFPTFNTAILRGLRCRCPNCGKGKLFVSFLKVTDRCAECGEEYSHHRADDFPAYLTILIVGHIVVTLAVWAGTHFDMSTALQLSIWLPITFILCLLLLQPLKGFIVAIQWHAGMHGFAAAKEARDKPQA